MGPAQQKVPKFSNNKDVQTASGSRSDTSVTHQQSREIEELNDSLNTESGVFSQISSEVTFGFQSINPPTETPETVPATSENEETVQHSADPLINTDQSAQQHTGEDPQHSNMAKNVVMQQQVRVPELTESNYPDWSDSVKWSLELMGLDDLINQDHTDAVKAMDFMDLVMKMKSDLEESGDHKQIDRIKQAMEKKFQKTKMSTALQFKPLSQSAQVNKLKRVADQQNRSKAFRSVVKKQKKKQYKNPSETDKENIIAKYTKLQ